jgi:hypothetical protein
MGKEVCKMPVISQFYGVLIYIYKEQGSKHHMPHFHARHAGLSIEWIHGQDICPGGLYYKSTPVN